MICANEQKDQGWCSKHHTRWYRHGVLWSPQELNRKLRPPKPPRKPRREKPLRFPNSLASVSFDVPRKGKYVGTPLHHKGANWMCVSVYPDKRSVLLRRFQDGCEADAPISECSRPWWWEG